MKMDNPVNSADFRPVMSLSLAKIIKNPGRASIGWTPTAISYVSRGDRGELRTTIGNQIDNDDPVALLIG